MHLVASMDEPILLHIDLHETTDSDETEFRPALAARDGKPLEPGNIPDGFYLVDDTERPHLAFQQALIKAVEKITHIAPTLLSHSFRLSYQTLMEVLSVPDPHALSSFYDARVGSDCWSAIIPGKLNENPGQVYFRSFRQPPGK